MSRITRSTFGVRSSSPSLRSSSSRAISSVDRDHLLPVHEQVGQEEALLRGTQPQRRAGAPDLERPKHSELDVHLDPEAWQVVGRL